MKLFGFGTPKPQPPSLEENLASALAEVASEVAPTPPANADEAASPATGTPDNLDPTPEIGAAPESTSAISAAPAPESKPAPRPAPASVAVPATPTEPAIDNPTAPGLEIIEPPRALFPGSFLGGEYEIKEIISRGPINYYLADAGDYGAHDWKFVAERASDSAQVFDGPDSDFFPPATRFLQDEREYGVWDFEALRPLEEWSAPPNDEVYGAVLGEVARGFALLESAGLRADLPPASLFFDGMGALKCFGFFEASDAPPSHFSAADEPETSEEGVSPAPDDISTPAKFERLEVSAAPYHSALMQLSALSSRFAKTNLGARTTLRLDDEFGALPFSDEVKGFARALNNGDFASVSEVVAALQGFAMAPQTSLALLTDVGMEREINEDCGLLWKSSRAGHARNFALELLAVADGMGGHEGGEVASDLTLLALEAAIVKRQNLDFSDNAVVLGALSEVLSEVNDAVIRLTENPPYAAMRAKPGATLVCALRVGSRVFLGNVGDSRAYRWNAQTGLQRLTRDHSYVQDLLDSGSLSEDEAWGHPDGSIITSHIGLLRGFKKDVFLRLLRPEDRLILVSDGVVDMLRDAQIEAIVAQNGEAQRLCAALVNAANEAGGADNITVAALICG